MTDSRFWQKIDQRAGPEGCWLWVGARQKRPALPYGLVQRGGKLHKAHRRAWELVKGPIPRGLLVLHSCDNPPCCNPAHLFLGTHQNNSDDKIAKGRARWVSPWATKPTRGESNVNAKLTQYKVIAIRKLIAHGMTKVDVAKQFGVTDVLVGLIVRRKIWRHV